MGKDFLKKEPSKTDKLMYQMAMHQQQLENQTFSNSMRKISWVKFLSKSNKFNFSSQGDKINSNIRVNFL